MEPVAQTSGRPTSLNTPGWILLGILFSGGLFLFVWLGLVGRRVFSHDSRLLLWLLPIGATLWVSGASLMVRGAMAPTVPGETGNPSFLAGFILVVVCLVLMFVFNANLARHLAPDGKGGPLHARTIGFTATAVGVLLSQLIKEVTPVAPQNEEILILFQLICVLTASVLGVQLIEQIYARYTTLAARVVHAPVVGAQAVDAAQRL